MVQPGVMSFGKKYSTTHFPRKSFRLTGPPSWDGSENSGAACPIWGTSAARAAANGNASSAKAVKMRCLKLIALSWHEHTTFRSFPAKSSGTDDRFLSSVILFPHWSVGQTTKSDRLSHPET